MSPCRDVVGIESPEHCSLPCAFFALPSSQSSAGEMIRVWAPNIAQPGCCQLWQDPIVDTPRCKFALLWLGKRRKRTAPRSSQDLGSVVRACSGYTGARTSEVNTRKTRCETPKRNRDETQYRSRRGRVYDEDERSICALKSTSSPGLLPSMPVIALETRPAVFLKALSAKETASEPKLTQPGSVGRVESVLRKRRPAPCLCGLESGLWCAFVGMNNTQEPSRVPETEACAGVSKC